MSFSISGNISARGTIEFLNTTLKRTLMLSFETALMLASDVVKLQGTPLNRGGDRGDGEVFPGRSHETFMHCKPCMKMESPNV